MSQDIDLAVVGAGPAGSSAAEAAASAGLSVWLVDKKSEIGSPVQCGGFLPEAAELKKLLPSARLPQSLTDIPRRIILRRTSLQRIYSPSGSFKQFSVAGRVLDRRAFDRHLAHRAAVAGARVLPATRARLIGGELHLSGRFSGHVRPRAIIGADGPHSMISRAMGNPLLERGICLEYEMVNPADFRSDVNITGANIQYIPGEGVKNKFTDLDYKQVASRALQIAAMKAEKAGAKTINIEEAKKYKKDEAAGDGTDVTEKPGSTTGGDTSQGTGGTDENTGGNSQGTGGTGENTGNTGEDSGNGDNVSL